MKKITFISDTHGQHNALTPDLQGGYMIVFAGDATSTGLPTQMNDFLSWFSSLNYEHKIMIAGNHDFCLDVDNWYARTMEGGMRFLDHMTKIRLTANSIIIPDNVIYLNDSGVTIDGINLWGSPITPWFHDWAFNRQRGEEIKKHWDLIPTNTNILITHGPVFGRFDKTVTGINTGCEDLLESILTIKPKIHVCGHIHEAYGLRELGETTFINASSLNIAYKYQNKPVIIDYEI